jgi:hypothetical protein
MAELDLLIAPQEGPLSLHIHANPIHNLYHYLAYESQLSREKRNPATASAVALMERARNPWGVHSVWDNWEQSLTRSSTVQDAIEGVSTAMQETVNLLGAALKEAEQVFLDTLWPQRVPLIEAALTTLQKSFVSFFPNIVRQQGNLLELEWPSQIDAFLVTECYAWQGAYSHPLTINVAQKTGLVLCETLLHEITHVGDIHTLMIGKESFRDRLITYLTKRSITRQKAWDCWHGIIFASSAQQIRTFVHPQYIDYAQTRALYTWLEMPNLPVLWENFAEGRITEQEFIDAIGRQIRGKRSTSSDI